MRDSIEDVYRELVADFTEPPSFFGSSESEQKGETETVGFNS